ncbi:MAG: hypothetical protein HY690_12395 [Chloroflexi bacterium]|nr:hypothetical protein [Chloroflexota bacterium]
MLETVQAVLRFLSAVGALESLDRVAFSTSGAHVDLWVILGADKIEDADAIYAAEEEYFATPGILDVDVHIVPLSRVDERNLPPAHTVFRR